MRHRDRVATALAREERPTAAPCRSASRPSSPTVCGPTWRAAACSTSDARRRAQPARRRQHLRARARARRGHAPHLGRLGQLLLPGRRHVHRRVGRHLARAALRDALRDRPLHRDGRPPAGRRRGHRPLRAARPGPAGALRRRRARHPRVPRRVLDRRRHRDDDLGDGLGAARLRAAADGLPGATPTWPTRSSRSRSATTWRRPSGWCGWAWT